jgi:hypothetical protein
VKSCPDAAEVLYDAVAAAAEAPLPVPVKSPWSVLLKAAGLPAAPESVGSVRFPGKQCSVLVREKIYTVYGADEG